MANHAKARVSRPYSARSPFLFVDYYHTRFCLDSVSILSQFCLDSATVSLENSPNERLVSLFIFKMSANTDIVTVIMFLLAVFSTSAEA